MTNQEAIKMMKAKLECMRRVVSGTDHDCNMGYCHRCHLNYEQGNMGEQKQWLSIGIKALEAEIEKCECEKYER